MLTQNATAVAATSPTVPTARKPPITDTTTSPFGYTGQYTDTETGFQYLRARYYDPATAQFLSRDPLVTETRSAYAYAEGNPFNLVDPSGLCAEGNNSSRTELVNEWTLERDEVSVCPNWVQDVAQFFGNGDYVRAGYYQFASDDPNSKEKAKKSFVSGLAGSVRSTAYKGAARVMFKTGTRALKIASRSLLAFGAAATYHAQYGESSAR